MSQSAVHLCVLACRQTQNSSDQEERTLWGIFRPLKITGGQQGYSGNGLCGLGEHGKAGGGVRKTREGKEGVLTGPRCLSPSPGDL